MLSIDDAFRRFQRHRDPADLAAVYDRCAPELLRVALHLTGRPADAEDLVQGTFLVAIERIEAFDPAQSVLPWLVGILVNRARNLRRRDARTVTGASVEQVAGGDPVVLAEAEEFAGALNAAIARLPEAYQPVFVLRFKHGLATNEIAEALRRPLGTVRTQLVRGLELLRKALPAGLVAALASGALPSRGLAGIRRTVLERAAACGTTTGAAATGKVVGLVAILCIAAAALIPRGMPADNLTPAAKSIEQAEAPTAPAAPSQGSASTATRTAREAASGRRLAASGRCIAAETGAPLAGCLVGGTLTSTYGGAAAEACDPVATDGEGRFELELPLPPGGESFRCHLSVHAAGRAVLRVSCTVDCERPEIGDIRLWNGAEVRGRVVDEQGAPVEGVYLSAEALPNPFASIGRGAGRKRSAHFGQSGNDGIFVSTELVPIGTWPLCVSGSGVQLVRPDRVTAGETVEIVVRKEPVRPAIEGRVLDEHGQPLAGLVVQARHDWPESLKAPRLSPPRLLHPRHAEILRGEATTDRNGRFRIVAQDAEPAPRAVHLGSFGWGGQHKVCAAFHDPREVTWGARDVELRVQRLVVLEVEVIEAATGAPVEQVAVLCHPAQAPEPQSLKPLAAGTFAAGLVRVAPPAIGAHWLTVVPKRADLLPALRERIEILASATTRARIALAAATPLRVRVVRADATPVANTEVRAYDASASSGRAEPGSGCIADYRAAFADVGRPRGPDERAAVLNPHYIHPVLLLGGGNGKPDMLELLSQALTDSNGHATLYSRASGPRVLHAVGPGHMEKVIDRVAPADTETTIVVEDGATLTIELSPAAVVAPFGHVPVELTHARYTPPSYAIGEPATATHRKAVIRNGTVSVSDLAPGRWTLQGVDRPTRHFELAPGERRTIRLNLGQLMPARLSGTVSLDGRTPFDAQVVLIAEVLRGEQTYSGTAFDVDGQGRFLIPGILPGTYRLALRTHASRRRGAQQYPCSEPFELAPGAPRERAFAFRHRRVRVRVVEGDGRTPVAATRFVVRGEPRFFERAVTDAEGRFVLEPGPDREVTLELHGTGPCPNAVPIPLTREALDAYAAQRDAKHAVLGPFAVPADAEELVVRIQR